MLVVVFFGAKKCCLINSFVLRHRYVDVGTLAQVKRNAEELGIAGKAYSIYIDTLTRLSWEIQKGSEMVPKNIRFYRFAVLSFAEMYCFPYAGDMGLKLVPVFFGSLMC